MTEKMLPIAFSPSMVKRILAREKTRTRRLFTAPKGYEISRKLDEKGWPFLRSTQKGILNARCKYGEPRQLLWMQEGIRRNGAVAVYSSTSEVVLVDGQPLLWRWKVSSLASRYCPREASRVILRNTLVRVERLQNMTEEEALFEGILCDPIAGTNGKVYRIPDDAEGIAYQTARNAFAQAWRDIHPDAGCWISNPWVWVVGFEEVERRSAGVQLPEDAR